MEDFFRGQIVSGKVAAQVPYRAAIDSGSLLAGVTNLSVKLSDLAIRLPESAETVTHVREFAVEGVDASLEDRRGRVGLLNGDGASVILRRDKAGAINLLGLLAMSPTNPPPTSAPAAGDSASRSSIALGGWTVSLDEIQLTNYQVKVEDSFPGKTATFSLDQVALNLKGCSTVSNSLIAFDGSFRLNETGVIAVRGTAKLAPLAADLQVGGTNLDLRCAQPYVDQFVSLGISSGALTTTGNISFHASSEAQARPDHALRRAVRHRSREHAEGRASLEQGRPSGAGDGHAGPHGDVAGGED